MTIKNYKIRIYGVLISIITVLLYFFGCSNTIDFTTGQWSADNVQISEEIFVDRIIFVVKESAFNDEKEDYPDNVLLSDGRYLELKVIFLVDGIEKNPNIVVTYYGKYLRLALDYDNKKVFISGEMRQDGKKIYINASALEEGKDGIKFKMF